MNNQELIVIKQLPVIEEQLKVVSAEIDEKVKNATGLICTEENVKTIKEVRASLTKEYKDFEAKRKTVKEEVLKPYNNFENTYKEYISNFVTYEQAKINVTLSASMKSLKEQAKAFIDKIVDDLNLIETQEHKTEILVEYKQTLNVSQSITAVTNRFKAIEEELTLKFTVKGISAKNYNLYLIEGNYDEDEIEERIKQKQQDCKYVYEFRVKDSHLSKQQASKFLLENMGENSEYVFMHEHIERN